MITKQVALKISQLTDQQAEQLRVNEDLRAEIKSGRSELARQKELVEQLTSQNISLQTSLSILQTRVGFS